MGFFYDHMFDFFFSDINNLILLKSMGFFCDHMFDFSFPDINNLILLLSIHLSFENFFTQITKFEKKNKSFLFTLGVSN